MITEKDLTEAIAYCDGKVDTKPNHAVLMAACYYLKDRLYPSKVEHPTEIPVPSYSYAPPPENDTESIIDYQSGTEFSDAIYKQDASRIWSVMDELMSVLQVTQPRLYNGVLNQIRGL